MLTREVGDKRLVSIRIGPAQPMVEVRHREHDAQLRPQLQQEAQQRDGVRSAGDGHADAVARPHQSPFADVAKYLGAHAMMVMQRLTGCQKTRPRIYADEHGSLSGKEPSVKIGENPRLIFSAVILSEVGAATDSKDPMPSRDFCSNRGPSTPAAKSRPPSFRMTTRKVEGCS